MDMVGIQFTAAIPEETVREILRVRKVEGLGVRTLGARFGLNRNTVWDILRRHQLNEAQDRHYAIPPELLPPPVLDPQGDGPVAEGERRLLAARHEEDRQRRCQDLLLSFLRKNPGRWTQERDLRSLACAYHPWEVGEALNVLRSFNLAVRSNARLGWKAMT